MKVLSLNITKDIGGDDGIKASDFMSSIDAQKDSTDISVTVSSNGGSYMEGLAIYQALKDSKMSVTCRVVGIAASAAILPLCAGKVVCSKDTWFFLHNPSSESGGDSSDHVQTAENLKRITEQYAGIVATKCGKTSEEICALMEAETYLDGTQAKALGLVDELTEGSEITALAHIDIAAHKKAPKEFRAAAGNAAKADAELSACFTACTELAKVATVAATACVPLAASSWEGAYVASDLMGVATWAARTALALADLCEDEATEIVPEQAEAIAKLKTDVISALKSLPSKSSSITDMIDVSASRKSEQAVSSMRSEIQAKVESDFTAKTKAEAEAKRDPRNEAKSMMDAFGNVKGAEYFAHGKTFQEAEASFRESMKAELGKVKAENAELTTKLQVALKNPVIPFEANAESQGSARVSQSDFDAYCKDRQITGAKKESLWKSMCEVKKQAKKEDDND
jgi:ATP-dependent protease ClpP protease subunit